VSSVPGSRVASPREMAIPSPRLQSALTSITAPSMSPTQMRESLQDIQLSIDTAIHILNDLLAYEKLESGILVAFKSLQPVQAFILDSIRPFRLQANEKAINLQVEECHEGCFSESGGLLRAQDMLLFIDEKKISQVIRNLLSNAIKFTPESGSVAVRFHYSTEETIDPKYSLEGMAAHPPLATASASLPPAEDIEGQTVEVNGERMVVQRRGTLTVEFVDTGPGITEVCPSLPLSPSLTSHCHPPSSSPSFCALRRTRRSSSSRSSNSHLTNCRPAEGPAWASGVSLPLLTSLLV
jgi:signal transduction histidine kinase